jgi:enamine deaminase RidA (YjgF/YER057c/UK114 family)
MSHLTYYAYEGVGQKNQKAYGYSQAVRVGDRIEIAGQGGTRLYKSCIKAGGIHY